MSAERPEHRSRRISPRLATFTVTNNGSAASPITFTDDVPAGLSVAICDRWGWHVFD